LSARRRRLPFSHRPGAGTLVLAARVGHPPSSLLLIDDKPENVAAACAAGWRAERYYYREGLEALTGLLARHGLPV